MNRAPPYRVMFERLLQTLKVEESKFVPKRVWSSGKGRDNYSTPAHMTRGLSLDVQNLGDGEGRRIQVEVYSGEGTGCSTCLLYSNGAGEFAAKVQAIIAGAEIQDRLK